VNETPKTIKAREAFSKLLRQKRKELEFSQEELADRTGLAVQYISMLERNVRQPTITTLFLLSDGLALPLSEFIKHIEEEI